MRVVVDTSIWSLFLRRSSSTPSSVERQQTLELRDLVRDGRIVLIGPIRQELLTGVASDAMFEQLREHLAAFDDEPLEADDHVEAARCANRCRKKGIAGSPTDFLICSVARRRELPIFTADKDFLAYRSVLKLRLHR